MMRQSWSRQVVMVAVLVGASGGGMAVQAQSSSPFAPSPLATGGTAPLGATLANPYMNPYLNPYMNPAAAVKPMTGRDAAVYMYMANSARGGIGSGVISGTRPLPGNATTLNVNPALKQGRANPMMRANPGAIAQRQVAEMPDSVQKPGAGAARYFNPGPVNTGGAGRYYNRRNTYFNSNGH